MKTLIIATLLLLPCLLVFNESEYLAVNFIGITYILLLVRLSFTGKGKRFIKDFWRESEKFNDWMFRL